MSKGEMREAALLARRSIPREVLEMLSREVAERLYGLPEFQRAAVVAAYAAKSDEVQTREVIERALSAGKRVMLPRTDRASRRLSFSEIHSYSDLSPGNFGVLEPGREEAEVPLASSDIILVPAVAWDERGYRIGYGKGYYDGALREKGGSSSVGLALETQRVARVPETPSDTQLEIVVTERRVVRTMRREG